MKNRYIFFKRLFKEYVIIINKKMKYYSFGMDKKLMKYIGNNDINYIIVNDDNTIKIKRFDKNNYRKYMYILFLEEVLEEMKFN